MITLDSLKKYLWGAAEVLRNQIDAASYKEFIFPLVFLKRISDVYDELVEKHSKLGGTDYVKKQMALEPIKIPEGCHWEDIRKLTENVGQALCSALIHIEQANPPVEIDGRLVGGLTGIFGQPSIWTNKDIMPDRIIISLINHFSQENLSIENCPADEMGMGYEYLVGQFADDAGNTAQEFYTNRTVVQLMAEILQPKPTDSIYDPTCGSGGMLIKSLTYLKDHKQEWRGVRVYGQELNALTASIARMNLFLHGVEEFCIANADTLKSPAFMENGQIMKYDVVLANPPYSISAWNRDLFMQDPYGRNVLGTPPERFADYAFIQHIICSMKEDTGRCAILLPHGVLNRLGEKHIRKKLVEYDFVDCIIGVGKNLFFNSPMEACIMICNMNKPKERKNKILFINARHLVERQNGESYLTEEQICKIVSLYHDYTDIEEYSAVATREQIESNGCKLSIGKYVKGGSEIEQVDIPTTISSLSMNISSAFDNIESFIKSLD